jgi:hypothetical protein
MSFKISDLHIEEFYMLGCTVFRSLLPPSLIADLRRECAKASQVVRAQEDEQAQRFQPVSKYVADLKPFRDYAELPKLREAIDKVLSPRHTWGDLDYMGVLIEPADASWCTTWHRDARSLLSDEEWEKLLHRYDLGCQVNCPLYDDPSTWFVPGSHLRGDTDGERAVASTLAPPPRKANEQSDEVRERACIEYCRAMPNAVCLNLAAGDYALYRPVAWHLGNYTPYRKRATLHDAVCEPKAMEGWLQRLKQGKTEAPVVTESPNGQPKVVA